MKHLAKAEYWYLTGNPKAAAEATEEFFNHNDLVVKISACYIYGFSNLAIGNTHMARLSFDCIGECLREEVPKDASTQFKSAIMLVESTLKALMHIPVSEEFTGFIKYLPEGLKAWELAQKDNIIMPFVTHQGLLYGLVENALNIKNLRNLKRLQSLRQFSVRVGEKFITKEQTRALQLSLQQQSLQFQCWQAEVGQILKLLIISIFHFTQ